MTKLRLWIWLALLKLDRKRYRVVFDYWPDGRPRHALIARREVHGPGTILDSWHDPADELPRTYCTRRGCPARKG
jgi:hypothetical protein